MAALNPIFVPGGVSPRDARIALGGLLASQGAGLDIRTGVLSGYTVTGTSATGPMQVSVAAGHHVAMRSTSDGPEVGANDGPTTVNIPAAPASNARIDLVWVRATDTDRDGSTAAEIGVTATGAVSATPTGPYGDVPPGALVLYEVRVAAGAVRTTDPQVTLTRVAKRTVARGGILPVANTSERDALTRYAGLPVYREDLRGLFTTDGTDWHLGSWAQPWGVLGRAVLGANQTGLVAGYTLSKAVPTVAGRLYEVSAIARIGYKGNGISAEIQVNGASLGQIGALLGGATDIAPQSGTVTYEATSTASRTFALFVNKYSGASGWDLLTGQTSMTVKDIGPVPA